VFVVDFDELHFGELFEVKGERACNGVQCAIRLTCTREVDVGDTVRESEFAITGEAVEDEGEPLIALHVAWTFEIFIEHRRQ